MAENNLKERYLRAKRRLFEIHYAKLNGEQREAVFTTEGSLLILAGAGSGKTTVLVNRIVFIVKYGNAYFSEYVPYDISEGQVKMLERAAELPTGETEELLNEFISAPCPPWQMLAITFTNKAANEIKNRLANAIDEDAAKSIWLPKSRVSEIGTKVKLVLLTLVPRTPSLMAPNVNLLVL